MCGGVNGGKAKPYMRLIGELERRIQDDYERGVIAVWHDESQLNRYIIDHTNYRLLTPSFCYPEGADIPFHTCLMVSEKSKKIGLDSGKVKRQRGKPLAGIRRRVIGMIVKRL